MLRELAVPFCLAVGGVASGCVAGRITPNRLPLWHLAVWPVIGTIAAVVSRAILDDRAVPEYHPVLFFTALGAGSAFASRLWGKKANEGMSHREPRDGADRTGEQSANVDGL